MDVLELGPHHRYDISYRALVMGILNRTPDSFYDRGSYWDFDAFLAKAQELVDEGADFLDVGGVKAGPGDEVSEDEELERVVPAVEALAARFDLPLSIDTWRASVAKACFEAGAVVGNDISGFADPDYLPVCAAHQASVVATHIRLAPRVADPDPHYDHLLDDVREFLLERARWATDLGIPPQRVMIDAGLDLGKTEAMSAELLRNSDDLAGHGFPVFLSASNKRFLGELVGTEVDERRDATQAAQALGIALGCRVLRAHDVRGSRRVADVMAAILERRSERGVSTPVYLIKGSDPVLQADGARDLVHELVGDGDRSMVVDEFEGDDYELAAVVNSAQTPPFLSDRRVVLARHAGRFTTADLVAPVVEYLADPLETSSIVLVWEKAPAQQRVGNVPKSLAGAVKESGGDTITTGAPAGKGRSSWVNEQIAATNVSVTGAGAKLIESTLGEDVNRLRSILEVLASTYGPDDSLGPDEIAPYLGEGGSVPPWELTDAIDRGDIPLALEKLSRMLGAGGRHPLQLLASLQTHFGRMLALDGAAVGGEKAAAEYLGMKGSTFPAKKALTQSRKLGSDGVREAALLLSDADVDLRGRSAWPGELVLEVLVARLSRLAR